MTPYCWTVDESGQQLPYLDEVHFRLSTSGGRDVQAVAGTADFSNLEQPENSVESLKKAADPASPARLAFGPRAIWYQLFFNLSANGWGEPDACGQTVRELNRNLDFRKAVTCAVDRQRIGDSLVKGRFPTQYAGGLLTSTPCYHDNARESGKHDWYVRRNDQEFVSVVQGGNRWTPTGPTVSTRHHANAAGELDLLPYEQQIVDAIAAFNGSQDPAVRGDAMKSYQRIFTENVNAVGLTAYLRARLCACGQADRGRTASG
jgi:ABC-type transport system substrate-binding protein